MLRDLFSLFPACAGVILISYVNTFFIFTFPRMCGGDPNERHFNQIPQMLFPACAGVIPNQRQIEAESCAFPRMCGGDPR